MELWVSQLAIFRSNGRVPEKDLTSFSIFLSLPLAPSLSFSLSLFLSLSSEIDKESCGDPGTPLYGFREGGGFSNGDVLRFECQFGFELIGERTISCQNNNQWSANIPICICECVSHFPFLCSFRLCFIVFLFHSHAMCELDVCQVGRFADLCGHSLLQPISKAVCLHRLRGNH